MASELSRRNVLRAAGALAIGGALAGAVPRYALADERPQFAHGIASGDPKPDRVVIWTRVTPTADSTPGSGRGPAVTVEWEMARDRDFEHVVASGTRDTYPAVDHTVKIDVSGLDPDTHYVYRFHLDGTYSPVGHTRTAPSRSAALDHLRLGVVSCANWQGGYFSAYRFLAERGDLDAVLHLGDYFYEYASKEFPKGYDVRVHQPSHEALSLADYRRRHAQYKSDADLRALHARCPWICMWDDHEVANDRWSDGAENHNAGEGDYRDRRKAAYQAYFEWMPVRDDELPYYRRLRFGALAELSMLDLRSYRSQQAPNLSGRVIDDPARTITGRRQFDWLTDGLVEADTRWKLVGNPVMMSPVLAPPLPHDQTAALRTVLGLPADGVVVFPDQWDGYAADRRRLLATIQRERISNVLFLTGDIHSSWANDVPIDAGSYPLTPSVATEFVCCSVTSDGVADLLRVPPRTTSIGVETAVKALNRHVRFVDLDSHGSAVLTVTPDEARMDWYYIADRAQRDSPSRLAHSYRVRSGVARVDRVGGLPVPLPSLPLPLPGA